MPPPRHAGPGAGILIPAYKQVPVFVIRNILRQLNMPPEEYLKLLAEL